MPRTVRTEQAIRISIIPVICGSFPHRVRPRISRRRNRSPAGLFSEDDIVWSRDGSQLYFTSDRVVDPAYELGKTDLYSVAASGGTPVKLTTFDMGSGGFSLSPDGKRLAFVASPNEPVQSYTESDLWVIDTTPGAQPRNLTAGFDYDVASGVGGDNAPPRAGGGGGLVWTPDGKGIITIYAKEGRANAGRFDVATGKETDITSGQSVCIRIQVVGGRFGVDFFRFDTRHE